MGVTAEGECASLCQSQGVTVYACASNGVPIACDRYRIDSIGDSIASKCCWLSLNLAECVGVSQLAIGLLRIGRLQVSSQGLMRSKVSSQVNGCSTCGCYGLRDTINLHAVRMCLVTLSADVLVGGEIVPLWLIQGRCFRLLQVVSQLSCDINAVNHIIELLDRPS